MPSSYSNLTPLNSTANDGITLQIARDLDLPTLPKSKSTDTLDRPSQYTDDGELDEFDIYESVGRAADIVLCLNYLVPSLLDPPSDVIEETESSTNNATFDIDVARSMFPDAPLFIVQRFGKASWRRRHHLKIIMKREKHGSRSPSRRTGNEKRRRTFRAAKSRSGWTSEAGRSTVPSIFSNRTGITGTTHGTSIAGTDVYEDKDCDDEILAPPNPPQQLSSGRPFDCSFCGLEIIPDIHIKGIDDWNKHVYQDLEPYMCTVDECDGSHKTYGNMEEWFQHELESHLLKEVWFCGRLSCRIEFDTSQAFEHHVNTHHKEIAPAQLSLLMHTSGACKRYSQKPLTDLPCILCKYVCPDSDNLKLHLAQHLEQFSLKTYKANLSDSDDESDQDEPSGDEYFEANPLVAEFLDEQRIRVGLSETNVNKVVSNSSGMVRGRLAAFGIQDDGQSDCAGSVATNGTSNVQADLADGKVRTEKSSAQTVRWNCPTPNQIFVGRQRELSSIDEFLSTTPGGLCVLCGQGGAGKTAIATEFLRQFGHAYEYVFWVDAETAAGCAESYNHIANLFSLGDRARDSDGLTILVREYLTRLEKSWLLVFDNVESWTDLTRYIPSNLAPSNVSPTDSDRNTVSRSILITARKSDLVPSNLTNTHQVPIEALTLEDSRRMLLQSMQPNLSQRDLNSHPEFGAAGEAAMVVERLPLAIGMVAGFARASQCTIADFLEIWEERQQLDEIKDSPIDTIWDIGIQELPLEARKMLDILSFLDPDTIPHDLLVGDHNEPALRPLRFLDASQPRRYQMTLDKLSGRSLVTVKEKAGQPVLSMHRIVQDKVKSGFDAQNHNKAFLNALKLVRKKYPTASVVQVPDLPSWDEYRKYTPHVLSLHRCYTSASPSKVKPTLDLAHLLYDAGFGVWACQTTTQDGISLLSTAESILDTLQFQPQPPSTTPTLQKLRADISITLANLLELTGVGGRSESLLRREQSRNIRQQLYTADPSHKVNHILLQNANNDYAISLLDKSRFHEAGEIFNACLAVYQSWDSEEVIPFEYAKYHHNMSLVLTSRGEYDQAIKSVRHAIHLTEGFSGKGWRYWQFQFTLACILLQAGDVQGAVDLQLDVLAGRVEMYGRFERSVCMSKYAVGVGYYYLGELVTAT